MNADLLRARGEILRAVREWFSRAGYLEVHTPVLVPSPALEEHLDAVVVGRSFLHTSPEMALKRVLAAGLPRIYQIGPCFREEEAGVHHSREFTMLEWYRAGAGTAELMDEVESLVAAAAAAVKRPAPVFERVAVSSLIEDRGDPATWFFEWVDRVEPTLSRPTIVFGYPPWAAAMASLRGGLADRFEVYLGGLELANAFGEELDPSELRQRLATASRNREAAGRAPHPVDEAFLAAVGRLPRCAGIALGIDRLVMALLDLTDIAMVQVRAGSDTPAQS